MGRLPVIQNRSGSKSRANVGRDHNTYGFSMWVAGGGFKAGHIHGATDEFGHQAVVGTLLRARAIHEQRHGAAVRLLTAAGDQRHRPEIGMARDQGTATGQTTDLVGG